MQAYPKCLVALAFLLCATLAFAQGGQTGGITGEVRDPTEAVVAGATVQIINDQTGVVERELVTGPEGVFAATLLRPGTYRVEVVAPGFRQHQGRVAVRIGENVRHVARLQVGEAAEVVTVEARATLVDTQSAQTGQPLDSQTLVNLPIPVPNIMYLLTLSAGASGEPPDVRQSGRTQIAVNVHGQRTTNNAANLEGINVNDFNLAHFDTIPIPNPNALQEFRMATSLYDATQGNKGGGNTNLLLRTGTSNWHFSAYWQHRNEALKANEWFTKRDRFPVNERDRLLLNVAGGSISGPVPALGGFFFGNIQGMSTRNGIDPTGAIASPSVPIFPTAADGTTSAALLAGMLPAGFGAGDIDPVAVNILNAPGDHFFGEFLVPRADNPACNPLAANPDVLSCTFSRAIPGEGLQHTITYDRPLRGDRDRLSLRWFHDNAEDQRPYGHAVSLAGPTGVQQRNRFASIAHQLQISPRQLNDFRIGYNRFNSTFSPTPLVNLADIGATRPNIAEIPDMYSFVITGAFSMGIGVNDDRGTIQNSYSANNTWSLVTGRHVLRAGGEVNYHQLNRFNRFAIRGSLGFAGFAGVTPFQSFLLGRPTSLQAAAGVPERYFRNTDFAFFVQDDWRIFPNLTLNLGLRLENLGFGTEKLHRIGNYYPEFAEAGMNPFAYPRDVDLEGFTGIGPENAVPNCVVDNCRNWSNWAPRVGFAWDMFGQQSTVLRGGYGIYYQRLSNQTTLQANLAPPFNVQLIESREAGLPAGVLANPFPELPEASLVNLDLVPQRSFFIGVSGDGDPNNPANFPLFTNEDGELCAGIVPVALGGIALNCSIVQASFTAPVRTLRTPYTQQWNLTLQQQLFGNWALELGYVGTHGIGGIGIFNPFPQLASPDNPITVTAQDGTTFEITQNTAANEPLRHAVQGLSRSRGARFTGNIGRIHYNAFEATLSHRFQGGLYFQTAYTWSKTIDNVSGSMFTDEFNITRAGQGGSNLVGMGNIEPRLSRARGDFDRPHRVVFSYTWDLPVPREGIWGSQAFQGWSVSGVTYYQSGLPFNVTYLSAGGWGFGGLNLPNFTCASLQDALTTGSMIDRVDQYLTPDCFADSGPVPFGTADARDYGDLPRNAFRGPMQSQWDFAVAKNFAIGERHSLRFGTDFFNIFNQAVFRAPAFTSFADPTSLGRINQTVIPARLIQFRLRWDF